MMRHFSHPHPLCPFEVEEEEGLICSGCELNLSGSAYKCNSRSSTCDFHLHKSCFELQREIKHASHPQHPLTLLSSPPSRWGFFFCNACDGSGSSFTYHCRACDIDLHVHCSSLPETVTRHDHQHPLALVFSLTKVEDDEEEDKYCGVCKTGFKEELWAYRCKECDYVIHLECVTAEADDDVVAGEEEDDGIESQQVEDDDYEEENEEAEEKTEDQEVDDDGGEETEEDCDSIIARHIERNTALQMVINNQNARMMRMQQQMMMNNTRRLFQFGL